MDAVKGIYHNGTIELIEKPETQETAEVLIIFPQKGKSITKIGGLFKGHAVDYNEIGKELKKLDSKSKQHMLEELKN